MNKQYFVYIATKRTNTIYVGVTNDLVRRMHEHRSKLIPGFTEKYNIDKLVYYELFNDINEAIMREKQLKGGSRAKKVALIEKKNPLCEDLYGSII